jgi:prefoldin subunit 5
MANSILNKVTAELMTLEAELSSFRSSVTYLNDAKNNVETAINAVSDAEKYHLEKLSKVNEAYAKFESLSLTVKHLTEKIEGVDFPKRLSIIENSLNQLMKELTLITDTTLNEIRIASAAISKTDFENHFSSLHKGIELLNNESASNAKQIGFKIDKDKNELEKRMSNSFTTVNASFESLLKTVSNVQYTISEIKVSLEGIKNTNREILDKLLIIQKEQFDRINIRINKFQNIIIALILISTGVIIYLSIN